MIKMIAEYLCHHIPLSHRALAYLQRSLISISIYLSVSIQIYVCIVAISFIRLNEILVKCQLFRFCDSIILSVFHHHFIFSTSLPEYSIWGSNAFLPFPAVFHLPLPPSTSYPSLSFYLFFPISISLLLMLFSCFSICQIERRWKERDNERNRQKQQTR